MVRIGVLALQGDVREHLEMVSSCNAEAVEVRTAEELDNVDGLIMPGGESTTLGKLMERIGLDKEIIRKVRRGMPVFGTCAGMILLSKKIIGSDSRSYNLIDIDVKRNDYGRQIESFEDNIHIKGLKRPVNAWFIRAPVIHRHGKGVEILAELNNKAVMAMQKNVLVASFHPELGHDKRIHKMFVKIAEKKKQARP